MPLYLPASTGKVSHKNHIMKNSGSNQKTTTLWHAHQVAGVTSNGIKTSVLTESASIEGLRRSLKTASQIKRESNHNFGGSSDNSHQLKPGISSSHISPLKSAKESPNNKKRYREQVEQQIVIDEKYMF
jgi:hypothetical protein